MTKDEVKAARAALKLTAREFAALLHVTPRTVNRWEEGTRGVSESAAILIRLLVESPSARRALEKGTAA